MVPTTFIGKLITFPAMIFGVLVSEKSTYYLGITILTLPALSKLIALPSIIVGRNFTIVWESMRRRQFSNRMGVNPMGGGDDVLSGVNTNETPITAVGK